MSQVLVTLLLILALSCCNDVLCDQNSNARCDSNSHPLLTGQDAVRHDLKTKYSTIQRRYAELAYEWAEFAMFHSEDDTLSVFDPAF